MTFLPQHKSDLKSISHTKQREFDTLSARTKRRRTKNLVESHSPQELAFAIQTIFTKQGKRNVHSLRTMKRLNLPKKNVQRYTLEESLALIVDEKLSKSQYIRLRKSAKERNCDIFGDKS